MSEDGSMSKEKTCIIRVYRGNPGNRYWEEFEIDIIPGLNIISALMEIARRPVNKEGKRVAPVVWEEGCLEEVCGSCSMLVNGRPRQACTALVETIIEKSGSNIITLAPLSKFPLVRDLIVDRNIMFENLKKVRAWVEVDTSLDRGPGPKISPHKQEILYTLSTCMTCGCCSEACPQINPNSKFIGPAAISQARLFNALPQGKYDEARRNRALMEEGGIADCGNAQNCQKVCPKEIPLVDSISVMGGQVNQQAVKDLFSFPDQEKSI
jgi:succinate dehydrogenase / fumarate reductase iron-sulfur subunit